jgi:DNA-binding XRE family transcriptional regulator
MPKLKKPLTPDQRIESRKEIIEQLDGGELKLGQAIRKMRLEWTGLSQGRFGKIVGLSANTLSAVERDADNTTVKTLNQILRRLGMRLTICSTVAPGPIQ